MCRRRGCCDLSSVHMCRKRAAFEAGAESICDLGAEAVMGVDRPVDWCGATVHARSRCTQPVDGSTPRVSMHVHTTLVAAHDGVKPLLCVL